MNTFALEVINLSKSYAGRVQALHNISFNIEHGDFFALLGPNGAGKSTTISIICSLVKKDIGTIRILGYDLDKSIAEAKSCIGLVPQEFNFSAFETPLEILVNQAGYYGVPRREALARAEHNLKLLDIWNKRDVASRFLSGGMKRRLMIARAVMHGPQILILDEPTAGVDIEVRHQIWNFLQHLNQDYGTTIVLTTHYLEEAEYLCRSVAIIDNGEIIKHGSMKDVLAEHSGYNYYIFEIKGDVDTITPPEWMTIEPNHDGSITAIFEAKIPLAQVISTLWELGVIVINARPQSNRLEKLFLQLTDGKDDGK